MQGTTTEAKTTTQVTMAAVKVIPLTEEGVKTIKSTMAKIGQAYYSDRFSHIQNMVYPKGVDI